MVRSNTLRVMISSRCNDFFPSGQTATRLSAHRMTLKREIEAMQLCGLPLFEVWINEETPPQPGTVDSWEACLAAVRSCDVLIVLYNGNAGWARAGGEDGICHAELSTALTEAPGKVHLIALDEVPVANSEEGRRNRRFQDYVARQNLFRGGQVRTVEELGQRVREALHEAVVGLSRGGVREASRGRFHSGTALDWSHLDFADRRAEMVRVLRAALLDRPGSLEDDGRVFSSLAGQEVLVQLHAVPAALSVGPAREMVGQPFLRDHLLADALPGRRGGPLHVIACHKTATEGQASKLLGYPDATFVSAPFGVFAADPVQKVQFAFLANCRDDTTTRHALQRFLEWLAQTGEETLVARRAQSRARIIRAIAKEAKL